MQHRPAGMVVAPVGVAGGGRGDGLQALQRPIGQPGVAEGLVTNLVERGGKAEEIVNLSQLWLAGDQSAAGLPVGRNHGDRLRPRQLPTEFPQAASIGIIEGDVHRRAVADEEGGHAVHDSSLPAAGI